MPCAVGVSVRVRVKVRVTVRVRGKGRGRGRPHAAHILPKFWPRQWLVAPWMARPVVGM